MTTNDAFIWILYLRMANEELNILVLLYKTQTSGKMDTAF